MTGPLDWTLGSVAAAVNGVAVGDPLMPVHSVTTDSRHTEPGSVFVAIRGETHDGHDYAADAVGAGAVAAMVRRGTHPDLVPRIEVEDTGTALRDLAAHRRAELDVPVIAVTGSTGKTSTKDLLAAAIPGSWASPRSYNNEIGVPLTVLSAPDTATTLVVEAGSRGLGHLTWLLPAIRPTVAVITNLGVVHFETFGSRDAVADGKWELVAGLPEGGIAVLPDDEPRLRRPHPGPTITFGTGPTALFRVTSLATDDRGRPSFSIRGCGRTFPVRLTMAGSHNALNAAAALAGTSWLKRQSPSQSMRIWRGRILRLSVPRSWHMSMATNSAFTLLAVRGPKLICRLVRMRSRMLSSNVMIIVVGVAAFSLLAGSGGWRLTTEYPLR